MTELSDKIDALKAEVAANSATLDTLVGIAKDESQVEAIKAQLASTQADLATAEQALADVSATLKTQTDAANAAVASVTISAGAGSSASPALSGSIAQ